LKTYYECLPCFMKQVLKALPNVDESLREPILRDVMAKLSRIDFSLSPPEMARIIFNIIEEYTEEKDCYTDIKQRSNEYILAMYDELKDMVMKSDDPFVASAKLAIAGNIIDFGAKHDFSDEDVHHELDTVFHASILRPKVVYYSIELL